MDGAVDVLGDGVSMLRPLQHHLGKDDVEPSDKNDIPIHPSTSSSMSMSMSMSISIDIGFTRRHDGCDGTNERMIKMTETTEWMRAPVPNRSSAVKGANRPHPTQKRHYRFTRINEYDKDHEQGGGEVRMGQATPYMHVERCGERDEDGWLQQLRSEMMNDEG